MSKTKWLRDSLHELRSFAQAEGLLAADDALRIAIIRVAYEQNIPTMLGSKDLSLGIKPQVPLTEGPTTKN